MRYSVYALMVASIGCIFSVNGQTPTFSLEDCIDYALENNEELKIATLDQAISKNQTKQALAQGLPQINGNVTLTNNLAIQTSFLPDFISPQVYNVLKQESLLADSVAIPSPEIFGASFGTKYAGIAGFSLSQMIFNGSFFVGLKAARTVKLLSEKEKEKVKIQIIEQVSKAYYLVLITKENITFLAKSFNTVDTLLKETELLYQNGFAEKIDVSRIKIQHNNIKVNLKNSADLLITAINILKLQMGMPLNISFKLNDDLKNIQMQPQLIQIDTVKAYMTRPEYNVMLVEKELLKLSILNYKALHLPSIFANFNTGWNTGTSQLDQVFRFNKDNWFRYTNVGIKLSIPIFDGLEKKSIEQIYQIQLKQLDKTISIFKNNTNREVIEATIKHNNAIRNMETQKENAVLAEEIYEVTRIKYREGVGSNLEVVEANTAYEETKTNYLNALYEVYVSEIDLKKALGTLK